MVRGLESRCEICGGWYINVTAHKIAAYLGDNVEREDAMSVGKRIDNISFGILDPTTDDSKRDTPTTDAVPQGEITLKLKDITIEEAQVAVSEREHDKSRVMFLDVDQLWRLANAMRPIEDALGGGYAYLVGSVLERSTYRDVDVRYVISDEEYGRIFMPLKNQVDGTAVGLHDQFRILIQVAISVLLKESTGLPVDFQIQSETEANQYSGKRNPVTLRPYIGSDYTPQWRKVDD